MKTSIRNMIASVTLALALAIPAPALPQSRRGDRQHNRTERPQPEQHGNRRPDRPGNRQPDRPRPNRPGNVRPGRPQSGRPATPPPARPGHVRPTPPQPPHNWSRPAPPPPHRYRVPRPIPRRPVAPPPGYRPYVHAPALRSILGITFGTVYASALTYLFNSGYTIDGYADNTIYLSDVTLLGSGWPLATLYCVRYLWLAIVAYRRWHSAAGHVVWRRRHRLHNARILFLQRQLLYYPVGKHLNNNGTRRNENLQHEPANRYFHSGTTPWKKHNIECYPA